MNSVAGIQTKQARKKRAASAVFVGGLAVLSACAGPTPRTSYRAPGPAVNQWGPYIQEASTRFSIPQSWIRAVMQQESGGHQYIHGHLVRSVHGAVGLMQLKPATYKELAHRYRLGSDPYDPHDNIMAGSGYIRELYDRFGSPQFLAAYNCGPQCAENHRSRGTPLPDYAKTYVAAIKPHLNDPIPAMLQPTQIAYAPAPTPPVKVMAVTTGSADASASRQLAMGTAPALQDDFTPPPPTPADDAIAVSSASDTAPASVDVASSAPQATSYTPTPAAAAWQQDSTVGGATIQIGAFSTQERAQRAAALAKQTSGALANTVNHIDLIPGGANGHPVWRTRLAGLPAEQTDAACAALRQQGMPCVLVIGQ
ncbi:murein transglycosylase [Acetobacter indonesiensis]|uniref:lytic transglycosylase domain-containing protein n=1 Tax=Acetobacter indonesiensis TaxID=104101 RepID=UPI000A3B359B|nr:lytic transglycosylase domain-containing protein [Acetobacter indonesiensis]OUI94510.1 murein transglycosylase [Acetobacter indonesiensis]